MKLTEAKALALLDKPLPKARITDPCGTYRQVKPIIEAAAFLVSMIPGWGASAGRAIRLVMQIADQACAATPK